MKTMKTFILTGGVTGWQLLTANPPPPQKQKWAKGAFFGVCGLQTGGGRRGYPNIYTSK